MALWSLAPAWAQTSTPALAPAPAEQRPKTLWDEFKLFSYIEMGATFNLNGGSEGVPGATSNGWTNSLRFYDIDQGYTFNMAELSIKRDPDEAFPFGMGLVLTAGQDAQKNHSIGILRDDNDAFPFRNTPRFDVEEAYISARIPIGEGPVVKVAAVDFVGNTHARQGDPADAILDVADETNAGLVIVGNKGMTGAKRFLLGSVPDKISHHAPCSVLIIRTT